MDTKLTDETAWNETITATYRKDPNYSYRILEIHNQVLDLVENRLTPHPDDLKELYSIYFNIIKNDHSRKFVEKKNRLTVAKSIYRSISVYPSVQLLKKALSKLDSENKHSFLLFPAGFNVSKYSGHTCCFVCTKKENESLHVDLVDTLARYHLSYPLKHTAPVHRFIIPMKKIHQLATYLNASAFMPDLKHDEKFFIQKKLLKIAQSNRPLDYLFKEEQKVGNCYLKQSQFGLQYALWARNTKKTNIITWPISTKNMHQKISETMMNNPRLSPEIKNQMKNFFLLYQKNNLHVLKRKAFETRWQNAQLEKNYEKQLFSQKEDR